MTNDNLKEVYKTSPESLLKALEQVQSEKKNLEMQRLATLNVLDDVHKAQEELAKRYDYIKNIRELLEKLTVSNDFLSVAEAAFLGFQKMVSNSYVAFFYNGIAYVFSDYKLPDDYQEKLKNAFLRLVELLKEDSESLQFKVVRENIEGEVKTGNNSPISFPIVIRGKKKEKEKVLGLIYIDRIIDSDKAVEEQDETINDILNLIAINLERIQALDASEHSKLSDLVESMADGVLMFDVDKRIILFNPVLQKMTGITDHIPTLTEFSGLFEKIDLESKIDGVLKQGKAEAIKDISFLKLDYEISVTPVRDYKKNIAGGAVIFHDITRLKELDRMKTDFVSVAAHQLRTPLGGVRWNLESMLEGDFGPIPEVIKSNLVQIHEAIMRTTLLINDLLNVSRIDQGEVKGQPEVIDVVALIKEMIEEAKVVAQQKKVIVNLELKDDKPFQLYIDPKHFRLIIENFLSNAITYNKMNGLVTITLLRREGQIQIIIEDTGVGIPLKDQVKLFSKFFRAANAIATKTEGSGLGLFVAKSYVEMWGGKIGFVSEEGKGTIFTVTLPEYSVSR